jgi:hypothetical protein
MAITVPATTPKPNNTFIVTTYRKPGKPLNSRAKGTLQLKKQNDMQMR